MNRSSFMRLKEGFGAGGEQHYHNANPMTSDSNDPSNYPITANGEANGAPSTNSTDAAASSAPFPTLITAGSRFRGHKEVDVNKWDEEANQHLLTMRRTPGDLCDCLRPCRKLLGLRYPPASVKMAENVENGFKLPCGVLWFVRDCAGGICMVFTWFLIFYAEFVVACIMLPQIPSLPLKCVFGIIYHIFAFLALYSHLKTVFTDPVSHHFLII